MGKGISEASTTATMVQNWIGGAWVTPAATRTERL